MHEHFHAGVPVALIAPAALALDAGFPALSVALCEVLLRRRSCRQFAAAELPLYQLSRLLWAAFGINRPGQSRRTAPAAPDMQEISVYVAMATGVYLYDPKASLLVPVVSGDLRAASGDGDGAPTAALSLIYVAKIDRAAASPPHGQLFHAALATGFISQNVYLFCAAEGLAAAVQTQLDRLTLGRRMHLGPDDEVILIQSLGQPLGPPLSAAVPEAQ